MVQSIAKCTLSSSFFKRIEKSSANLEYFLDTFCPTPLGVDITGLKNFKGLQLDLLKGRNTFRNARRNAVSIQALSFRTIAVKLDTSYYKNAGTAHTTIDNMYFHNCKSTTIDSTKIVSYKYCQSASYKIPGLNYLVGTESQASTGGAGERMDG